MAIPYPLNGPNDGAGGANGEKVATTLGITMAHDQSPNSRIRYAALKPWWLACAIPMEAARGTWNRPMPR